MANTRNTVDPMTTVDPMEIMETVFIPKASGEDPHQFVSLNGRTWLIPKNKQVEVPRPVAAIIRNSQQARDTAEEFRDAEKAKMNAAILGQ